MSTNYATRESGNPNDAPPRNPHSECANRLLVDVYTQKCAHNRNRVSVLRFFSPNFFLSFLLDFSKGRSSATYSVFLLQGILVQCTKLLAKSLPHNPRTKALCMQPLSNHRKEIGPLLASLAAKSTPTLFSSPSVNVAYTCICQDDGTSGMNWVWIFFFFFFSKA